MCVSGVISSILQALGNESLLYVGRCLIGYLCGLNGAVFSVYNMEMVPAEKVA